MNFSVSVIARFYSRRDFFYASKRQTSGRDTWRQVVVVPRGYLQHHRSCLCVADLLEPCFLPFLLSNPKLQRKGHVTERQRTGEFHISHFRGKNERDDRVILGGQAPVRSGVGMGSAALAKSDGGNVTVAPIRSVCLNVVALVSCWLVLKPRQVIINASIFRCYYLNDLFEFQLLKYVSLHNCTRKQLSYR